MKLWISLLIALFSYVSYQTIMMLLIGAKRKKGDLKQVFVKLNDVERKEPIINKKKNRLTTKQYFMLFAPIGSAVFIISLMFFRSVSSAVVLTFVSSGMPYLLSESKRKRNKKLLNYQFREALRALSTSLKAGSSLRNGLRKTYEDLVRIYGDKYSKPIVDEFSIIAYELDLMLPVEEVLRNFELRADLEDISDFVNVAIMTKKQGGDLVKVIERVTTIISDRIEIEYEIETLVSGKKMEARLLTMLPIGMVLMLSVTSPRYMSPMYESTIGKILMITAALLLIINYFVGKKIIDIEV